MRPCAAANCFMTPVVPRRNAGKRQKLLSGRNESKARYSRSGSGLQNDLHGVAGIYWGRIRPAAHYINCFPNLLRLRSFRPRASQSGIFLHCLVCAKRFFPARILTSLLHMPGSATRALHAGRPVCSARRSATSRRATLFPSRCAGLFWPAATAPATCDGT